MQHNDGTRRETEGRTGEEKEEAARYKESGETSLAASRKVTENRTNKEREREGGKDTKR